jgi:hypothetical protein
MSRSLILLLLLAVSVTVFLATRSLKKNPAARGGAIRDPKILVCSLGDKPLAGIGDTDVTIYSRYSRRVDATKAEGVSELIKVIGQGYGVVHLYAEINADGYLTDGRGAALKGSELLEACRQSGVALLFFASDNPPANYEKAFGPLPERPGGDGMNVVWTLKREGDKFTYFLDELLKRMAAGESMPLAWVHIAPQGQGPWMDKLPETVYLTNR